MRKAADSVVYDDIDAKPGTAVSLLRTLVGLYLRQLDGWVSTANLVMLCGDLGISESATRNAVSRVTARGLLLKERRLTTGYAINPRAIPMLARGDRRIFSAHQNRVIARWCVVSFSVEESQRATRDVLRRKLRILGAGQISSSLWVLPGHLKSELADLFTQYGVSYTVFMSDFPEVHAGVSAETEVASWWDLAGIRLAHENFLRYTHEAALFARELQTLEPLERKSLSGVSFMHYVRAIDSWRPIPYLDPVLPDKFLPSDWPWQQSIKRLSFLDEVLSGEAADHVQGFR